MSIVYSAFDSRIDRRLAIKVLRERYARDVTSRQRFLREARAAGGLAHPNIVTVFDVGQTDGLPYLVMEHLSGGTLAEWIESGRTDEFDVEALLDVGIQLAGALAYAHKNGIIHRDLKPANIHYDPETGQAKIMDFGIAAIERGLDSEGKPAGVAGTPTHMPPEQLLDKPVDARSDLYSLGVVLYQLLSGQLPFDGEDAESVVRQVIAHQTRELKPTRPETPRELTDLVYRLIAHEPDSRPASARQVREELEEIRGGLKRGILHTVRDRSPLWRWPVAIGATVALVLVIGLNQVYRSQTEAIEEATYGYGDALASLVAQETAEALILEDTTALAMLVSDFSVNPQVEYLHISDETGRIQASTNPFLQGQAPPDAAHEAVPRESGSVSLYRSGEGLLEFRVPIRFQARRVGEARLGLDATALQASATTTLSMLAVVFVVSVLIVALGVGWMVWRQHRKFKRLAWGLKRLARGHFDFRIEPTRLDEMQEVYQQFNRLAVHLEERLAPRPGPADEDDTEAEVDLAPAVLGGVRHAPDETLDLTRPMENTEPDDDRDGNGDDDGRDHRGKDRKDVEGFPDSRVTPLKRST